MFLRKRLFSSYCRSLHHSHFRQRVGNFRPNADPSSGTKLRHIADTEIFPRMSFIELLESPFSCFVAYALGTEDLQHLFSVVAEVFFFDYLEESRPVLGERADVDLLRVKSCTVRRVVQEEALCCLRTFLREPYVVVVCSFRRRPCIDLDAVDARGILQIVPDMCCSFSVGKICRVEFCVVEAVKYCEIFRDGRILRFIHTTAGFIVSHQRRQ